MNKPETKKNRKLLLLLFAVVIGLSSLVYTNILVKRLQIEEKQKIEQEIKETNIQLNKEKKKKNSALKQLLMAKQ